MLALASPAPIWETLELAQGQRAGLKPWQAQAFTLQLLRSVTVAFRDGAELVAVAGFMDLPPERPGEQLAEIWFLCRPSLARYLPGFIRLARLTCARAAQDGRVRIRAFVREGHAPGARLAVLCGLRCVAVGDGFERWEWQGEIRTGRLRGEESGRAGGAPCPEPDPAGEPGCPAERGGPADPGAGPGPGAD